MKDLIGKRVKLNNLVAPSFEGQTGEIEEERVSSVSGQIYIVKLDNPVTVSFSQIFSLGVSKKHFELI